MEIDRVPRYAPSETIVMTDGGAYRLPVLQWVSYPAGAHPTKCPIVDTMVALELKTAKGSAWWGFEKAWINSELRMVVSGFPAHDELRNRWPIVETDRGAT